MDINTTTSYNYTHSRDTGCKLSWEGACCPHSSHEAGVMANLHRQLACILKLTGDTFWGVSAVASYHELGVGLNEEQKVGGISSFNMHLSLLADSRLTIIICLLCPLP